MVGESIVFSVVMTLIMIPISALLLWLSAKVLKMDDTSYITALIVAAILGAAGFIFNVISILMPSLAYVLMFVSFIVVSIALALWLIKRRYDLDWKKAVLLWIVWLLLSLVVAFIVGMIVGVILVAIGMSGVAAGSVAGLG